ncbi:MAG: hypothetical protein QOF51_696 [Chloroflexota bacterium]|nr:hypothetical protein [Chloroflexota bacterium]
MNESDPRVRRTRKLLIEAFGALLTEKSFHAISVQDVAERATVNRATFYAHFEDKYGLLDSFVGDAFKEALEHRLPSDMAFSVRHLRILIVTVLEYVAQFNGRCASQRATDRDLEPLIQSKLQSVLHAFLLGWLQEVPPAEGAEPIAPETTATVLSWAIFGAGLDWARYSDVDTVEDRARQLLALLIGGTASVLNVSPRAPASATPTREAVGAR